MKWFVVYTRSRYEQKVKKQLEEKDVEVFLPTTTSYRKWSDRVKKVEVPLFRSYVFVKTHPCKLNHYLSILQTPGVVRFVTFEKKPVSIPDIQVQAIKKFIADGLEVQPLQEALLPGTPVEISHGPLKGLRGEVVRCGAKQLLIIQIDVLDKSIQVTIPGGYLNKSE
jgi:transcription termination/antitermination protein NusG